MIVTKTYCSKSNTICQSATTKGIESLNLGLNPILEISHGQGLTSRALVYFDHSKVKQMVNDKIYPDINKLHHTLHMFNTASLVEKEIDTPCPNSIGNATKHRACSFDLIFFLIPQEWDNGRGFEYVLDLYNNSHSNPTYDGSSWNKCKDYFKWNTEEDGIYSLETMEYEFELFTSSKGNRSDIIFGYQHFDYGNESINIDITDIFNKFIKGELENYGFGIMFAPKYEAIKDAIDSYVGFFSPYTHSFYEPYIETIYDEYISDDRNDFYAGKDNKLYFYASVGGDFVNLDEMPTCSIEGQEYPVKQASKGVYYIDINISSDLGLENTMQYDVWSNLRYKGRQIKDVELSFVIKEESGYFNFGLPNNESLERETLIPSLYGIQHKEEIKRGDIRKISVDMRIPYTSNQKKVIDGKLEYRLFVEEGISNHVDVIEWAPVERGYDGNYFYINTNELLPHRYFIDIRYTNNSEVSYHRKMIEFDIISDMTNKKV